MADTKTKKKIAILGADTYFGKKITQALLQDQSNYIITFLGLSYTVPTMQWKFNLEDSGDTGIGSPDIGDIFPNLPMRPGPGKVPPINPGQIILRPIPHNSSTLQHRLITYTKLSQTERQEIAKKYLKNFLESLGIAKEYLKNFLESLDIATDFSNAEVLPSEDDGRKRLYVSNKEKTVCCFIQDTFEALKIAPSYCQEYILNNINNTTILNENTIDLFNNSKQFFDALCQTTPEIIINCSNYINMVEISNIIHELIAQTEHNISLINIGNLYDYRDTTTSLCYSSVMKTKADVANYILTLQKHTTALLFDISSAEYGSNKELKSYLTNSNAAWLKNNLKLTDTEANSLLLTDAMIITKNTHIQSYYINPFIFLTSTFINNLASYITFEGPSLKYFIDPQKINSEYLTNTHLALFSNIADVYTQSEKVAVQVSHTGLYRVPLVQDCQFKLEFKSNDLTKEEFNKIIADFLPKINGISCYCITESDKLQIPERFIQINAIDDTIKKANVVVSCKLDTYIANFIIQQVLSKL